MKSILQVTLLLLVSNMNLVAAESSALRLTATIPLVGVKGRFDHFAIDAKGHRLFVAALGNNTLEIVDTVQGKRLQSITGLHKPTGVAYLPEMNRIVIANGDDGTLKLFDASTYALVKTLGSLDDADNVRFDAKANRLYVGYRDGALAAIDPATMTRAGTIALDAHPESFQLESQGTRIFVNVPEAKYIAVVDRDAKKVSAKWPMTDFRANFPMALDEAHHLLFVGCREPARLVVFNTATGTRVFDFGISGDADDLFYDARLKRLYISCGEGFVDVIDQAAADNYTRRERIPTRNGARTSFFSAELNEFYLAVPNRGNEPAELRVFRPQP
jgi:DNA-binding beta-propeller fold protein YncE